MIIQSKRNEEKIIEITLEQWEEMKASQLHRHWRILSSRDLGPADNPEPEDVINFMKNDEVEVRKIYDEDEIPEDGIADYNLMLKGELVTECKKLGIELTGKEKKQEIIDKLNNV